MNVQAVSSPIADVEADVLAIGLFDGDTQTPPGLAGTPLAGLLGTLIEAKDISRTLGEVTPLIGPGSTGLRAKAIVLFGLGARDKFNAGLAFASGVALGKKLAGRPRGHVAVTLPDYGDPESIASALVEGLIVATVSPELRKTEKSRNPFGILSIVATTEAASRLSKAVARGEIVGNAINLS